MKGIIITVALLMSLGCAAIAADNPKVTLDAQSMPMDQLAAELTKQSGTQIICDSDVKANVTARLASVALENVLDSVTKPAQLKWQKVYLPTSDEKPTLEQVKSRAQAVAAITAGTVIVYDPVTGKQKVFVEQKPDALTVDPAKLGLTPVYLITKPKAETADAAKNTTEIAQRYSDLENERTKLMSQMTPDQRVWAMQQEMTSSLSLDTNTRQQMMMDRMRAMREMDPTTRDQLHQTMRDTWQSMRDQGVVQGNQHWDGGGRGDHGNHNSN